MRRLCAALIPWQKGPWRKTWRRRIAGGAPLLPALVIGGAAWLCLSAAAVGATSAQATDLPQIAAVRVGVGDYYKAGLWTQIAVTLRGGAAATSGAVTVVAPDSDGVPTRVTTPPEEPCRVEPGQENTVRLLTRIGRVDGALTVEFRTAQGAVVRRTLTAAKQADANHFLRALESRKLFVVVGSESLSNQPLGKLLGGPPEERPVVARVDSIEQLPLEWAAYEGVDAVILSTQHPEIYQGLANNPRLKALETWVRMGGQLVLCVGAHGPQVLAPDAPLSVFAPGQFAKTETLGRSKTSALETYGGGSTAIFRPEDARKSIAVARLTGVHGQIEAKEADLPLVVRTARCFGQTVFVATDLDEPLLSAWADRPMFVARLLGLPSKRLREEEAGTAIMHFGYNDLAGQLRSALDQFQGVGVVSFSLVAAIIVVYILLIGPGDYFFLRKVARRMLWTWVTFPAVAAVVCVGAYYLADYMRGRRDHINQVDLVDVDVGSRLVRGTTWANVYSPRLNTFALALQPHMPGGPTAKPGPVLFSWFGLTGGALGGMNPRTSSFSQWTQAYDFSPSLDAMAGVPIQVGATKSLTARWSGTAGAVPQADLTEEAGILFGKLVNTLDFPLENGLLAFGNSVYQLKPTIAPGETAPFDSMSKRSELRTLLTGQRLVLTNGVMKFQQETTAYDNTSTDPAYVLRMMMFYDVIGGRRYTGLLNDYQEFVDGSLLLKTDRAILVAHAPAGAVAAHGARLLNHDQPLGATHDPHIVVYRFVFPVKHRGEEQAQRAAAPAAAQLAGLPLPVSTVSRP